MENLYRLKESLFGLISPATSRLRQPTPKTPTTPTEPKDSSPSLPNRLYRSEPRKPGKAKRKMALRTPTQAVLSSYEELENELHDEHEGKDSDLEEEPLEPQEEGGEYEYEYEEEEEEEEEVGEIEEEEKKEFDAVLPRRYGLKDNREGRPSPNGVPESQAGPFQRVTKGDHDTYKLDEDEDDIEDEEEELTPQEKVELFLAKQAELVKENEIAVAGLRKEGWNEEEIELYQRLHRRGLEPLLPAHWRQDFRTCPAQIFTYEDDETFINAASMPDFRAIHALEGLTMIGRNVRSLVYGGRSTEQIIKQAMKAYLKWACYDAGVRRKRYIPIYTICACRDRRGETIGEVSKRLTDQMRFLARAHRQNLTVETGEIDKRTKRKKLRWIREPPVIYGAVIVTTVVMFVTLDSRVEGAKIQNVASFNFAERQMDVWNGFAIGILGSTVRNQLRKWADDMEDEDEESDDPDL